MQQVKSTVKSKTIFEGIVFYLQEILECLLNVLECFDNCIYMIKNGIIDSLLEILCHKLTGEINLKFTVTCLNTLLSVIICDKHLQEHIKYKLQDVKIKDILQDLTFKQFNGISESAEICLVKIWLIDSYEFAYESCLLENDCKKFIDDVLLISSNVFLFLYNLFYKIFFVDDQINKEITECHCRFCHSTRNFPEYGCHGNPPRAYSVPIGWYFLGLKSTSKLSIEDMGKNYHRAYYGTRIGNVSKILRHGDLVTSFSNIENMKKKSLDRTGETAKERVNVSPSLRYSGLEAFSESYQ